MTEVPPRDYGPLAFPERGTTQSSTICLPTMGELLPTGSQGPFNPAQEVSIHIPIDGFLIPSESFITMDVEVTTTLSLFNLGVASFGATMDRGSLVGGDTDADGVLTGPASWSAAADGAAAMLSTGLLLRPIVGVAYSPQVCDDVRFIFGGDHAYSQCLNPAAAMVRSLILSDKEIEEGVGVALDKALPATFGNTMTVVRPSSGTWVPTVGTAGSPISSTTVDSTSTLSLKIPLTALVPFLAGMEPFPAIFCSDNPKIRFRLAGADSFIYGMGYLGFDAPGAVANGEAAGVSATPDPAQTQWSIATSSPGDGGAWPSRFSLLGGMSTEMPAASLYGPPNPAIRARYPVLGQYLWPFNSGRGSEHYVGSPHLGGRGIVDPAAIGDDDALYGPRRLFDVGVRLDIKNILYKNVRMVASRFRPLDAAYATEYAVRMTAMGLQTQYQQIQVVTALANESTTPKMMDARIEAIFNFQLYNVDSVILWLSPSAALSHISLPFSIRNAQLRIGSANNIPDQPIPGDSHLSQATFRHLALLSSTLGSSGGGDTETLRASLRRGYLGRPRGVEEELRSTGVVSGLPTGQELTMATSACLRRRTGRPRHAASGDFVFGYKFEPLAGCFGTGFSADSVSARLMLVGNVGEPFCIPPGAVWNMAFLTDTYARFTPNRMISTTPQGW